MTDLEIFSRWVCNYWQCSPCRWKRAVVELLSIITGYSLEKKLGSETLKGGIEVPQEFMHLPPHWEIHKEKMEAQSTWIFNKYYSVSICGSHSYCFFNLSYFLNYHVENVLLIPSLMLFHVYVDPRFWRVSEYFLHIWNCNYETTTN